MAFQSRIFWGCLGAIILWIFIWSWISNMLKSHQPYRNRHLNKFADNVEIVAIIPLIPPILFYALCLRFFIDPLRRSIKGTADRWFERRHELAERSVAGERRLKAAEADLAIVRREKMPLYDGVEVRQEEPLDTKTPAQTITPKGFPLAELPAELRIQIYQLLDYGTALRLAQVNRYFHFERPYNSIDKEQRMTFLFYADAFARNKGRRLACYECLKARSRRDFLPEYRSGKFDRFCESEFERRCFDCVAQAEDVRVSKSKLWMFRFWRWRARTFDRKGSVVDEV